MSQPVIRSELIEVIQLAQAIFLSHSAHDAARVSGDEAMVRQTGEKAIEHSLALSTLVGDFIKRWTGRDVGE